MNPFNVALEFISEDNRIRRSYGPVSAEQMLHKHESLLPPYLLAGKTILDLGSCLGATGHWALSHDSSRYTGVEMQNTYVEKSRALLEKYHAGAYEIIESDIRTWLTADTQTYDIVCLFGIVHAHVDYYGILRAASQKARELVVVEEVHPAQKPGVNAVFFSEAEAVNLADEDASVTGRGVRLTPGGLAFVMADFGFSAEGPLEPNPDEFRYRMRFTRRNEPLLSAMDDTAHEKKGRRTDWNSDLI